MKVKLLILLFLSLSFIRLQAQVWQWSVAVDSVVSSETNDYPQAYLWVPEQCKTVKAVVFAQHNMIEEGMLEHETFRNTMRELGIAEMWVTPGINMPFNFKEDAGEDFARMMNLLADASGYSELSNVPVIPLGHSAYASFPWNFAAWNPKRTLAILSIHGDAPQTNLTGYGRANVDWGNRNIDGVPALFVMGEYEWWEDRIAPAFAYINKLPKSVISLFCDAGHGHFDYSDELIAYTCLFIRKAVAQRLAKKGTLLDVVPEAGWLMDRWHKDSLPIAAASPYSSYKGDRAHASWVFDKEMADATEAYYASSRGKAYQHIGFMQEGKPVVPANTPANYQVPFKPHADGISFRLSAFFADSSRVGFADEHASTPLFIDRICGPVKKIDDSTFQLSFNRLGFNNPKRSFDIWLLAHNKGDRKFKSAVQQLNMRFPAKNETGVSQQIVFEPLADQRLGVTGVTLKASSSAGLPVGFYVREGPAYIADGKLVFTAIPPSSKFPIKVSVVAWQYGIKDKVQTAQPVTRIFYLVK